MKKKLKHILKNIKLYASLPHFWITGIILILSIIACIISIKLMSTNPFLSSVFSNIFAGLITGIVISLISTIKSITLYRTECIIIWLESLHKDILQFIEMHRKIIFRREDDLNDEAFYNHIYDTLCCGHDINTTISQGQFNQTLPFNSYEYIKKHFGYDAIKHYKNDDDLREKVIRLDVNTMKTDELIDLFAEMEHRLFSLNSDIINHITYLKTKMKAINISFM